MSDLVMLQAKVTQMIQENIEDLQSSNHFDSQVLLGFWFLLSLLLPLVCRSFCKCFVLSLLFWTRKSECGYVKEERELIENWEFRENDFQWFFVKGIIFFNWRVNWEYIYRIIPNLFGQTSEMVVEGLGIVYVNGSHEWSC